MMDEMIDVLNAILAELQDINSKLDEINCNVIDGNVDITCALDRIEEQL